MKANQTNERPKSRNSKPEIAENSKDYRFTQSIDVEVEVDIIEGLLTLPALGLRCCLSQCSWDGMCLARERPWCWGLGRLGARWAARRGAGCCVGCGK